MSQIPPMKFVHVVYRTRRFDQMVRWYQTYDDEHHRFAFAGPPASEFVVRRTDEPVSPIRGSFASQA